MEFRKMRRNRQELGKEACEEILLRNTAGVLAVLGDNGYPYAVPLSYVYQDGALYFHCAKEGHKLDALETCPKASFCVVDQDEVVPEKYTTCYRSAIAFGQAQVLAGPAEAGRALEILGKKYAPMDSPEHLQEEIAGAIGRTAVIKLTIEHMTGKEGLELVKRRNP